MCKIDLNEQFIVYVVFNGVGRWYISDKEIWYLDYNKWIGAYQKAGYEINKEHLDTRRRHLLCLDEETAICFIQQIEADRCSSKDLSDLFFVNNGRRDFKPSLYVDFDRKELYSMYTEPASYEDYVPTNWNAQYQDFLELIPMNQRYWEKQDIMED